MHMEEKEYWLIKLNSLSFAKLLKNMWFYDDISRYLSNSILLSIAIFTPNVNIVLNFPSRDTLELNLKWKITAIEISVFKQCVHGNMNGERRVKHT